MICDRCVVQAQVLQRHLGQPALDGCRVEGARLPLGQVLDPEGGEDDVVLFHDHNHLGLRLLDDLDLELAGVEVFQLCHLCVPQGHVEAHDLNLLQAAGHHEARPHDQQGLGDAPEAEAPQADDDHGRDDPCDDVDGGDEGGVDGDVEHC